MPLTLATRKMFTSALYLGSAVCAIANLALTGSELSTADLAISICGVAPWGLAGMQSFYNRYQARKKTLKAAEETVVTTQPDEKPCIPASTHALINSALHITSATFFIISDLKDRPRPLKSLAPRLTGSFLWLTDACINAMSARKILRAEEDHPGTQFKLFGYDAAKVDLFCEAEYITAGVMYAISIWSAPVLNHLKLAGNVCWLLAGTHDIITAYLKMRDATASQQNEEPHPNALSPV